MKLLILSLCYFLFCGSVVKADNWSNNTANSSSSAINASLFYENENKGVQFQFSSLRNPFTGVVHKTSLTEEIITLIAVILFGAVFVFFLIVPEQTADIFKKCYGLFLRDKR